MIHRFSRQSLHVAVFCAVTLVVQGLAAHAVAAGTDVSLTKRTRPGREVLIRGFAEFDADCKLRYVQKITILDAPANGRVDQRPGEVTIAENWVGEKSCAGTKLNGVKVYYTPNDGFVGTEHFSVDVTYARFRTVRANVEVKVE